VDAPPDAELVGRAKTGDADAFEELIHRHSGRLIGLLSRMIGDAALAEDAAQEALVRAWRALPRFRGDAQFSTWLYRIGVNEANRITAREARREIVSYDDVVGDVPDLSADILSKLEVGELRRRIESCLLELPEGYRAAVVLRDVEGFSNEEAAEILELSIRSFKSRLHRGRMALRKRLEELEQDS
jgi:RNA polymerase sigma-70 factor (ECF subfamily)